MLNRDSESSPNPSHDVAHASKEIFAKPKAVAGIDDCDFYHVMDLPGLGQFGEEWDLRPGVDAYLGHVDFRGKRVLELGTADGYLCFEMERRGAHVIAYDLSENEEWDIVPFAQYNYRDNIQTYKRHLKRLNNAWWLCHKLFQSRAQAVYGSVYQVPPEIGRVDIATFGSILLHVRDPFLALQRSLSLVEETVIITDLLPPHPLRYAPSLVRTTSDLIKRFVLRREPAIEQKPPYMEFLPDFKSVTNREVWWFLSPEALINFLGVLGFEDTQVTFHKQKFAKIGTSVDMFTIVGTRTRLTTV